MSKSRAQTRWKPSTPPVDSVPVIEYFRAHRVVAIHFWAEWNENDRAVDESIKEIRPLFSDRVDFVSCDTDAPASAPLCQQLKVHSIPLLAVVVDGERRRHIAGVVPPDRLAAELETRLLEPPFQDPPTTWFNRLEQWIVDVMFMRIEPGQWRFRRR